MKMWNVVEIAIVDCEREVNVWNCSSEYYAKERIKERKRKHAELCEDWVKDDDTDTSYHAYEDGYECQNSYTIYMNEVEVYPRVNGEDLACLVSDYCNGVSGGKEDDAFVRKIVHDHPTLLQNFTRLMLKTFKGINEANGDFTWDDRKKASVEIAKRMKDAGLLDEYYLPHI